MKSLCAACICAAIFVMLASPASARTLPGPDDAQGSYDETVTAKWDETMGEIHTLGSLSMTYHVDFWLVGRVSGAEYTYVPDGNFTFLVKGGSTDTTTDGVVCTISGTVGGSGPIKAGTVSFTPATGEWYFKDIVLPDLRDGLHRDGACHEGDVEGWNLNFGGNSTFGATADRLEYQWNAHSKDVTCNNDDSMTGDIIPTWFSLPIDKNKVQCDTTASWHFKGKVGPSKTMFISPFLPIKIGKKKPPQASPKPPCRRTDNSGQPKPCATPTPKG